MKNTIPCIGLMFILVMLVACSQKPDEVPVIRIQAPATLLAEGDTLLMEVTLNDETLQEVSWNQPGIQKTATGYRWIVPSIQRDTLAINLVATYEGASDVKELLIYKRAFTQPAVSYAQFVVPLFEQNCNFSGCHGNGSRAGKVSLATYDSTARVVQPYNAAGSLLYAAILRDDPLRWMPPAGKLQPAKIEQLRLWMEQGARNN